MARDMPKSFPHPYGAVPFPWIPEVSYVKLVHLHRACEANGRRVPRSLKDALRKALWAKSAAIELQMLDAYMSELSNESDVLVQDLVAHVRTERALFDFAAHLKSALDAMSIFANDAWRLNVQGSKRDLKSKGFRRNLAAKDPGCIPILEKYSAWMRAGLQSFENVVCLRDTLIHKTSLPLTLQWPAVDLGAFPVPRGPKQMDASPAAKSTHLPMADFTQSHLDSMFGLLAALTDQRLVVELAGCADPPLEADIDPNPIYGFPVQATGKEKRTLRHVKFRLGSWADWTTRPITPHDRP